jgi:hypothetical protein
MGFFKSLGKAFGLVDDVTIEQFDVNNTKIFPEAPDSSNSGVVFNAIMEGEDIVESILFFSAFFSVRANVNQAIHRIEDSTTLTAPSLFGDFTYFNHALVGQTLSDKHNQDCTITKGYLDLVTDIDWVLYWLSKNRYLQLPSRLMPHDTPGVYDWVLDISTIVVDPITSEYTVSVTKDLVTEVLPYSIPAKPTTDSYVVTYYLDSDPTNHSMFVYAYGDGKYPALDNVTESEVGLEAKRYVLPALPLRLNSVNYNTTPSTKSEEIDSIFDSLGINANDILDGIMTDPNVVGHEDVVDHVYYQFGISMWDLTPAGLKYLYTFFQDRYAVQRVTNEIYSLAQTNDHAYNTIRVENGDYAFVFSHAYITYTIYSLAEVDADPQSTINGVYYSDASKFDSNGDLVHPYFASTGNGNFNVGYTAENSAEIDLFLAGNGIPSGESPDPVNADRLQVTRKFNYNEETLVPYKVYEDVAGVLTEVVTVDEVVIDNQQMTYYQITASGLYAYTVQAPKAAFRVKDTQSGVAKLVNFSLADKSDILVPLILDRDLTNNSLTDINTHDVAQLIFTGSYASIYVAEHRVEEVWDIGFIIDIITVVTLVYGGLNSATTFDAWLKKQLTTEALKKFAIQYLIKRVVLEIAKKISPEMALVAAVYLTHTYGTGKGLDYADLKFIDAAELFKDMADMMSNIIEVVVAEGAEEYEKEHQAALEGHNKAMELLADTRKSLGLDDNDEAINLLTVALRSEISPMFADAYLDLNTFGKYELNFIDHEYSYKIEQAVTPDLYA